MGANQLHYRTELEKGKGSHLASSWALEQHQTKKREVLVDLPVEISTPTRFELARAEPIGFQNQLLNHSDTVSPVEMQMGWLE